MHPEFTVSELVGLLEINILETDVNKICHGKSKNCQFKIELICQLKNEGINNTCKLKGFKVARGNDLTVKQLEDTRKILKQHLERQETGKPVQYKMK